MMSSSFADVDNFCFYANKLVTVVGLTNDERCLIHNLRVEKKLWFRKNYKKYFQINEHS